MGNSSFLHIGLTVSDFDRTVEFYSKYFGFELEFKRRFPDGFFAAKESLYRLGEGNDATFGFIRSPDGIAMELFQFDKMLDPELHIWNRPGFHHIALKVDDVIAKCKELEADGVELFFQPDHMGDPADNKYWVFFKDPDGNMIELQ